MKLTKFFMTFLNDDMAVITYRSVLYVCACLLQSKVFQSSSHREITRKKYNVALTNKSYFDDRKRILPDDNRTGNSYSQMVFDTSLN